MSTTLDSGTRGATDSRTLGALDDADPHVAEAWGTMTRLAATDPPLMGLAAGDRPLADVEVLAGVLATTEYTLAARMHAAASAGSLPMVGPGAVLVARGWSAQVARRLARAGALAADHPRVAAPWRAGTITAEHVDAVARRADRFARHELAAVISALEPHWGRWSPAAITRFVRAAERILHPPPDPTPDESDAHACRALSFAVTGDSVIISGELPRVEGELVIAAIDAFAERLRSAADHVPAAARRADALVELINAADTSGSLPSRGGLPVAVTVTLAHTNLGDPEWTTSRGHLLTDAEARWAACDPALTPLLVSPRVGAEADDDAVSSAHVNSARMNSASANSVHGNSANGNSAIGTADAAVGHPAGAPAPGPVAAAAATTGPAARLAALAATMFACLEPLAVGRTQRTATSAQRRVLATRDGGCVIPGCQVPAEACQTHHVQEWADDGPTDLANLALLCWAHHRQVDLHMWTIAPTSSTWPVPTPDPDAPPDAPPGTPWPGNNGSPWIISRTPRTRWRL